MPRSLWLLLLLSSLVAITAGCGGGGENVVFMPTPTPTPAPSPSPNPSPSPIPTPTPTPSTVTITLAGPAPAAVAEQIGTGNWTATPVPGNGSLVVQVPFGTTQYGVALLCTRTDSGSPVNVEWIIEADLKDGASYTLQLCNPNTPSTPPPTGSLSGSVDATAISGTHSLDIFIEGEGDIFENVNTASFNTTVPTGTADLYAVAYDSTATILAMKILRSQTVPGAANGGNPIVLTASDAVTLQPITIANAPSGGFTTPTTNPPPLYVSAHGSFQVGIGFVNSTQYAVVSAADSQPGDYYTLNATAGTSTQIVSTQQYLTTTAPVTLALPSPWSPAAPIPAAFPTFTFDYTGFSGQPVVTDFGAVSWNSGFNGIGVYATANHQNGTNTLPIPNLTSLSAFSGMTPSGVINWSVATWGGTTLPYLRVLAVPQTLSSVSAGGSYTQP